METLALRHLTFTYPRQSAPALRDVSLTVERGDFFLLCGPSGCGKSTLLRQLKTVLTPHGAQTGDVLFAGVPLDALDQRTQSQSIGFVRQSPDDQLVTDKVWHELAFGLESLGYDTPTIRRRVAEMASFFGIEDWFYKNVSDLSGGQKQLLNLASVMTMQPHLLILDEPTSQLDPIAAADFLGTLGKLNRELGLTVLLTEHRLEETLPLASQMAVLDEGRLLTAGEPRAVALNLKQSAHPMFRSMPTPVRVWAAVPDDGDPCPLTVREGRDWLARRAARQELLPLPEPPGRSYPDSPVLSCKDVWFKYEKDSPDILRRLSLNVKQGEFLALLGGNGTGKSTLLKLLAGLEQPYRGSVTLSGPTVLLPQEPQALFVKKTVREDLYDLFRGGTVPKAEQDARVSALAALCRLDDLLDRHPYDLSGGEQQRAALAKVLLLSPGILLLDEPTKGLDSAFKETFAHILETLSSRGVTILMVSHDVEFCAAYAHRCALLFDGGVVTDAPPRAFFSGNSFYTTAANRMARDLLPDAVTANDLIAALGGSLPPPGSVSNPSFSEHPSKIHPPSTANNPDLSQKLPLWRKALGGVFGLLSALLFLHFVGVFDLSAVIFSLFPVNRAYQHFLLYALFSAALILCAFAVTPRPNRPELLTRPPAKGRTLSRRAVLSSALILLLIPLTLFVGVYCLAGKKYYFISLLVLLEAMLPFFIVFEGRKPQPRELIVIAVLCALAAASRAALIMLPQFKPSVALTIISGVAFGGETGFLVGAVSMLTSNIMLGQGPYTPFQMFAAGIIGFLAGVLFRKGFLRRSRTSLCIFGALTTLVIYGGIMNLQSALQASPTALNLKILLAYCASGFPMDCIHAAATWFFLWVAAEPMLEKLERIKAKYGLVE